MYCLTLVSTSQEELLCLPQRFGPDLVVFPAASSTCYFSERLSAAHSLRLA